MKTPEQIKEDYSTAIHELAHCEIFNHYGVHSVPEILKPEERYAETSKNNSVVAGTCTRAAYQEKEIRPFEHAVAGWAGAIMENIAGVEKPTLEISLPLNAKTLKDCFNQAMVSFEKLSIGDQNAICKFKRSYWKSFKRAYHLLRHKKNKLMKYADFLLNYSPPSAQSIPQPPPNPVTDPFKFRADLLRQFLAGMSPENLDRPRLERMLECLERGEWPTAEKSGIERPDL